MDVHIVNRNVELKKTQVETLIERCQRMCARFLDSIASMTLRLHDINGGKGGIDKECLVRIRLNNGLVMTAVKREENVEAAIAKTLDAARALIRRKLGERKR